VFHGTLNIHSVPNIGKKRLVARYTGRLRGLHRLLIEGAGSFQGVRSAPRKVGRRKSGLLVFVCVKSKLRGWDRRHRLLVHCCLLFLIC